MRPYELLSPSLPPEKESSLSEEVRSPHERGTSEKPHSQKSVAGRGNHQYFWVDKALLKLELNLPMLLTYLLYARSCNHKTGCAFPGAKKSEKALGLDGHSFRKARKSLCEKFLLKHRPDATTGVCPAGSAYEVLRFPQLQDGQITPSEGKRNLSSAVSHGRVIALPDTLIDEGLLKGLSLDEVRLVLYLYGRLDLNEWLGVKRWTVCKVSADHDRGVEQLDSQLRVRCSRGEERRIVSEAAEPTKWVVSSRTQRKFGPNVEHKLDKLILRKLFKLVPVVLTRPIVEGATSRTDRELISGGHFWHRYAKRYLTVLDEEERVVWILRPRRLAHNTDHDGYKERRKESKRIAEGLYSTVAAANKHMAHPKNSKVYSKNTK